VKEKPLLRHEAQGESIWLDSRSRGWPVPPLQEEGGMCCPPFRRPYAGAGGKARRGARLTPDLTPCDSGDSHFPDGLRRCGQLEERYREAGTAGEGPAPEGGGA
jgi:hypothetical protein